MTSSAPPPRWVPVAYGSLADLSVLRGLLDANRIPTDIPSSTVAVMTVFSPGLGGSPLTLCVPDTCERRALALLECWPREHRDVAERMEHGPPREP